MARLSMRRNFFLFIFLEETLIASFKSSRCFGFIERKAVFLFERLMKKILAASIFFLLRSLMILSGDLFRERYIPGFVWDLRIFIISFWRF